MTRYSRIFIALFILLSGVALIPQVGIFAGVVSWQRFASGYEDVVTVTRARYHNGELRMRAISSAGGNATLTVYRTADNSYIGTLQFEGEDHRGEFELGSDPHVVTVRSSLGGWATVLTWDESDPPITVTPSPQPPTSTPDPNATSTPTTVPSSTPEPGATETPQPPTSTPDPNATSTPTSEPSATPDPNATSTPTSEPSATPDPDATSTPTTEPTATATNTPEGGPTDPNSPGVMRPLYLPLVMQ